MEREQAKFRRLSAKELQRYKFFKNFKITFREKGKIPETGVYEVPECLEELPNFRCGSYKDYTPEDGTAPQGKEKELFKVKAAPCVWRLESISYNIKMNEIIKF